MTVVHPFCSQRFSYGIEKNVLIMYLCNDREHVAACQGISLIPTNATIPHYRGHVSTNLAVATLHKSIMSPTKPRHLVAWALPRMTWQVRLWFSASHKRLNLGTTAHIPKAVPDINRYTHLFLNVYLSVYLSIYPYICICTNDVCLPPHNSTTCKSKTLYEICAHLGNYTVCICNFLPNPKAGTYSFSRQVDKGLHPYAV